MIEKKFNSIAKEIHTYFNFLFEKGYRLQSITSITGLPKRDWMAVITSSNMNIAIHSDEGEISLGFYPIHDSRLISHIDIDIMIYHISHGEIYIGRYKRYLFNKRKKRFELLSNLLKEYLDRIEPFFGNNFDQYEHELIMATQKYDRITTEKYYRKSKPWFLD